jgi:hypothetical protein
VLRDEDDECEGEREVGVLLLLLLLLLLLRTGVELVGVAIAVEGLTSVALWAYYVHSAQVDLR